jgi:DNA transformation protein
MSESFHEFARELFAGVGAVQIKRMFGGAGGYVDGVMFLLLDDEVIYLKVDAPLKSELAAAGSQPFDWEPQNGPRAGERVEMGYWRLPEAALDDPEEAVRWGRKALAVAKSAKKPAKAKTTAKKKPPAKRR